MVLHIRDYNPFANVDLHIPKALHEEVTRYTTSQSGSGGSSEESSPFNRYVDLWSAAVAVGAEEDIYVSDTEQHRFIQGSVLQGDLVRIEFIQLIAIARTQDAQIVTEPRRVIDIADAYAAGGLPILLDWLDGGVQTPMMSLTKKLIGYLEDAIPWSDRTPT